MANTATLKKFEGDKPRSPMFAFTLEVVIDTYAAGGVDIEPLAAADLTFKAKGLDLDDAVGGFCNLKPDVAGLAMLAEYDRTNKKVVLKEASAGPVIAEVAPGAVGPITVEVTLLLG